MLEAVDLPSVNSLYIADLKGSNLLFVLAMFPLSVVELRTYCFCLSFQKYPLI